MDLSKEHMHLENILVCLCCLRQKGLCEEILERNKLRCRWASVGPTGQSVPVTTNIFLGLSPLHFQGCIYASIFNLSWWDIQVRSCPLGFEGQFILQDVFWVFVSVGSIVIPDLT